MQFIKEIPLLIRQNESTKTYTISSIELNLIT